MPAPENEKAGPGGSGLFDGGPDLRVNTRTTRTNPLIRALFWNMPFHAEHPICPMVPFHALPALHRKIGAELHPVGAGFLKVHREVIRNVLAPGLALAGARTGEPAA